MKILVTVDPYIAVPPKLYGGIERIAAALIGQLRRRGHAVGLVAHPDSTLAVDFFAPWPSVRAETYSQHAANMRALTKACAEFRPGIVHSFSRLLYLGLLLARRIPKVMSYQRYTGGRQITAASLLAGRSLQFTGCSQFIAAMGRRSGGRWRAIYNFVDTDFYEFSPYVAQDAPLVFLSRVERIKGTHVAIEIARKSGRRLVIAGNHAEEGPERAYWDHVIKPELGDGLIDYVGPVDDAAKLALLQSAAALVVPIQWDEPFGIVFAEALACGTPIISCPRGALPEIIASGTEGFLIRNVEEGCRAVARLATIRRDQCRQRADAAFSARNVVPLYEALYAGMMPGSAH